MADNFVQRKIRTVSVFSVLAVIFPLLGCFIRVEAAEQQLDENNTEEQVTFYPAYGYEKNGEWIIPLRLWVHEKPGIERRALATAARKYLANRAGLDDPGEVAKKLFEERAKDFVADSESNETVAVMFENDFEQQVYTVTNAGGESATDRNGLLEGVLKLDEKTAERLLEAQQGEQGWLRFHATSDDHWGVGYVKLISPTGLSIISDIDDTIKVTGIPAGESVVLQNTFFRDFVAVPSMAEMYRSFGDDVAFHYVSGSPWQMYKPLADFLFTDSAGFPFGSFHMKNLRTNPFESESYQDFWTIIACGSKQATFGQKVSQISAIMTHFPQREFILIGDSGEKDPEVYKQILRDFPTQVREIRIRVLGNEKDIAPGRLDGMIRLPGNVTTDHQ